MSRLRQQLERAIELALLEEAGEDRVAALLIQQRAVLGEAVARFREWHGRDLRVLVLEDDALLCELYEDVAGAFGIACDVATDANGVKAAGQDADHALVIADPKWQEAIAQALVGNPRPMLVMTPAVAEVNRALQSPFMERSLGMLVKPFELEPLAYIVAHWTLLRLIGEGVGGSGTAH
jgi:hypothetical protein